MVIHSLSGSLQTAQIQTGSHSNGRGRGVGRARALQSSAAIADLPAFRVSLSDEALRSVEPVNAKVLGSEAELESKSAAPILGEEKEAKSKTLGKPEDLSRQEEAKVTQMERRDKEVRNHERAHQSAGGRYTGAASFTYTSGPDGRRYATSGEVPIDVSPVGDDHAATIQKMAVVRRAALAPTQPSGVDRGVAAQASQTEQQARHKLLVEKNEEAQESQENRGINRGEAIQSYAQDEELAEPAQTVETGAGNTGFESLFA